MTEHDEPLFTGRKGIVYDWQSLVRGCAETSFGTECETDKEAVA